jgi:hypothetical protein
VEQQQQPQQLDATQQQQSNEVKSSSSMPGLLQRQQDMLLGLLCQPLQLLVIQPHMGRSSPDDGGGLGAASVAVGVGGGSSQMGSRRAFHSNTLIVQQVASSVMASSSHSGSPRADDCGNASGTQQETQKQQPSSAAASSAVHELSQIPAAAALAVVAWLRAQVLGLALAASLPHPPHPTVPVSVPIDSKLDGATGRSMHETATVNPATATAAPVTTMMMLINFQAGCPQQDFDLMVLPFTAADAQGSAGSRQNSQPPGSGLLSLAPGIDFSTVKAACSSVDVGSLVSLLDVVQNELIGCMVQNSNTKPQQQQQHTKQHNHHQHQMMPAVHLICGSLSIPAPRPTWGRASGLSHRQHLVPRPAADCLSAGDALLFFCIRYYTRE